MDAEIKKKWVEALRSGEYTQAIGYMCNSKGHCCLGVLAEVLELKKELMSEDVGYCFEGTTTAGFIAEAGMKFGIYNFQHTLQKMNDDENKSFSEIADWIEENL